MANAPQDQQAAGLRKRGPELITGAANADPSGMATYSQAGAQFGFNMLWTVLFTCPQMVGTQLVSAGIIGTGVLAFPVLAGSSADAMAGSFQGTDIMGQFVIPTRLKVMGWLATLMMAAAVAAMFLTG